MKIFILLTLACILGAEETATAASPIDEASSIVLANGESAVFKSVMRAADPHGCYWERI